MLGLERFEDEHVHEESDYVTTEDEFAEEMREDVAGYDRVTAEINERYKRLV